MLDTDGKLNLVASHLVDPTNLEVANGYFPDLSDPFTVSVESIRELNAPHYKDLPTSFTIERALVTSAILATSGALISEGAVRKQYTALVREIYEQPEIIALLNDTRLDLPREVASFIILLDAFGVGVDFTKENSLSNFSVEAILLALFKFSLEIAEIPTEGKFGSTFDTAVFTYFSSLRLQNRLALSK